MEKVIGLLEQVVAELKKTPAPAPVVKSTRFSILNDGWILDRVMGLEWGQTSKVEMNHEAALKHCAELGGRLPTLKELQSLVDYTRHEPAIDNEVFKDTRCSWYWTSTPCAWNAGFAWCVGFGNGSVGHDHKDGVSYVRPVRASQCVLTV